MVTFSIGDIILGSGETMVIHGPGSFQVGDVSLNTNSVLDVDNLDGPVTLYVTGTFKMWSNSEIASWHGDPERLAIYVATDQPVSVFGWDQLRFEGVIYAPYSDMDVWSGDFYGALVAKNLRATWNARIHYPTSLRGVVSTGIVKADTDSTSLNGGNTIYKLAAPYSPTSDGTTSDTTTDGTKPDSTTPETTKTKPGKGNEKK